MKGLVRYVARYLGRPCIGTSRIDSYNGNSVTFHYEAHIGNGSDTRHQSETLPALDFILHLCQHIQEPHFVMVRYFGLYSTHGLNSEPVAKAFQKDNIHWLYDISKHKARLYHCHWRGAMKYIFQVDPLICPCCHEEMIPVYYVFNGKTVYDPPKRRRRKQDIVNPRAFAYKEALDV